VVASLVALSKQSRREIKFPSLLKIRNSTHSLKLIFYDSIYKFIFNDLNLVSF
jgi:hypothetical protein